MPELNAGSETADLESRRQKLRETLIEARKAPESLALWEKIEDLAALTQEPEEAASLYVELLGTQLPDVVLAELARRATRFHEEWFGENSPELLALLKRLFEAVPSASDWAFQRLTVSYTVAERWDELMALYDRALTRARSEDRRIRLLEEAAQCAKDFANRPDDAIRYLRELLALRPTETAISSSLERLLEKQKRWEDLVLFLASRIPHMSPDEVVATRLRSAEIWFDTLNKAGQALESLEALVAERPQHEGAFQLLERIVDKDDVSTEVRHRAFVRLKHRYDEEDRTSDVVRTIGTALGFAEHGESIDLHREAANRLLARGRDKEAMQHFAALLRLEPSAVDAREQLRLIAERSGDYGAMIESLLAAAAGCEDVTLRMALRIQAADTGLERLQDLRRAIGIYALVLEEAEQNVATALPIVRRLVELYGAVESTKDQLETLERLAQLETEAVERRAALGRAAALADRLGDPDRALRAWDLRIQDDPRDSQALDAMVELLSREQRWEAAVRALRHRITISVSPWQRREDLMRIAAIEEEKLGNLERAISTWVEVVRGFGEHPEAFQALFRLFSRTERWRDLAGMVQRAVQRDGDDLATMACRLGEVYRLQLREYEASLAAFQRALAAEPGLAPARSGMQALLDFEPTRAQAAEALAQAYRTTDDWSDLLALLEVRLSVRPAGSERAVLLEEASRVREERAGDRREAARLMARALVEDPLNATYLKRALRLTEAGGEWEGLAEALHAAARAASPQDEERAGELLFEEGKIRESRLNDFWGAVDCYYQALERLPEKDELVFALVRASLQSERENDVEALVRRTTFAQRASAERLKALAQLQRRLTAPQLFDTLLRLADATQDDLDVLREAAEVILQRPNEKKAAAETLARLYDAACRACRANLGRRERMAAAEKHLLWSVEQRTNAYREESDVRSIVRLLMDTAQVPIEVQKARALRREAARLAVQELKDSAWAIEIYQGLYADDPQDRLVVEALIELYEADERLPELLAMRQHHVSLLKEPVQRVEARLQISSLLDRLEAFIGRIDALLTNLQETPGHAATLSTLETVLRGQGRFAELAQVFAEQATALENTSQTAWSAQLWIKAAQVQEESLGSVEDALICYRRAASVNGSAEAFDALARLHFDRNEPVLASEWLQRRLTFAQDKIEHVEVAKRLAEAYVMAGNTAQAIEVLRGARAVAPERVDVREFLATQYRLAEAWEPLAELLADATAEISDPDQLLRTVQEASLLFHEKLRAPERAVEALQRGLFAAPDHSEIRLMLVDSLHAAGRFEEAQGMLETMIASFGRRRNAERATLHHRLAQVRRDRGDIGAALEELDVATSMDIENVQCLYMLGELARQNGDLERSERAFRALLLIARRRTAEEGSVGTSEVLYELHQIAKARGDLDQAGELLESALEAATQSEAESQRLRSRLSNHGEFQLLLRALEMRLQAANDAHSQAVVLAEVAQVLDSAFGRSDEAFDRWLQAIRLIPESATFHESALRLARRRRRLNEYVQALRELATNMRRRQDSDLVASLLLRAGQVTETELSDLDAASEFYRLVESTGHRVVEAWLALARISGSRGEHAESIRFLERALGVEGLESEVRLEALYRLAELRMASREGLTRAVALLKQALELRPQYDRAAQMLQPAVRLDPSNEELQSLYERVARATGNDTLIFDYLEQRTQRDSTSIKELREAVDYAMALGQEERSEGLLKRAFEVARKMPDGTHDVLWALKNLADRREAAGDVRGAMVRLQQAIELVGEAAGPDLRLRLALLAAGPRGDLRLAAKLFDELHQVHPEDSTFWKPLIHIYQQLGEEEGVEEVLRRTLARVYEPRERVAVKLEWARALLGDEEKQAEAVQVLREILDESPGNADAADLLSQVYEKAGYDDELAHLLTQQLEAAENANMAEDVVALSLRLGAVLERVHREDAVDVYTRALRFAPEDRRLIESILRLFRPGDDVVQKADVLERLLAIEEGERAAETALEIYAIRESIHDLDGMQKALELGYSACPDHAQLRSLLEHWYRNQEAWPELARFLVLEADRASSLDEALKKLREAAFLWLEREDSPASAALVLRQARQRSPQDLELLRELVAALELADDRRAAIDEVSAAIDEMESSAPALVELLKLRAQLRGEIGDHDSALGDLEQAYALAPAEIGPVLLERLMRSRLQAIDSGERTPERQYTLRLVVLLQEGGELGQARALLKEWVERSPDDEYAWRSLLAMERADENWAEVARCCEALVGLEQGEAQLEVALELSQVYQKLGRPGDAIEGLERAYANQPEEARIAERLAELYEANEEHRRLADLLVQRSQYVREEGERFQLLCRVGSLFLGPADDVHAAIPPLEEAVRLNAEDHTALLMLADAYMATERFADAGQMLADAIESQKRRRTPELALLQHRMAVVARLNGERDLELQWLQAALLTDKNNGEVAAELAWLAIELGELDVALQALRAVTLMRSDGPMSRAMAFLLQAKIAYQRGEEKRALLWARKARAEDPALEEAAEFLRELGDA